MSTRRFIATGAVAWLGGIATAFAVASCEPELAVRGSDYDLPEATPIEEDGRGLVGEHCDRDMARPSAYVTVVRPYDGFVSTVSPEHVWFQHGETIADADCVKGADEHCTAFIAGYERAGELTVFAEYCDTVVSETIEIGKTSDGCHVQTAYLQLEASTRGCLAEDPDADPGDPWPRPMR